MASTNDGMLSNLRWENRDAAFAAGEREDAFRRVRMKCDRAEDGFSEETRHRSVRDGTQSSC
jgi:hypothetical protein